MSSFLHMIKFNVHTIISLSECTVDFQPPLSNLNTHSTFIAFTQLHTCANPAYLLRQLNRYPFYLLSRRRPGIYYEDSLSVNFRPFARFLVSFPSFIRLQKPAPISRERAKRPSSNFTTIFHKGAVPEKCISRTREMASTGFFLVQYMYIFFPR